MSNERKMLEYAANACGITKDDSAYNGGGSNNTGFDIMGNLVTDWHNGESWNPLTNSADCAAMCAKLAIGTDWISTMSGELHGVVCTTQDRGNYAAYFKDHNNDREAAWRFAACKVAEAIGKGME